jgi:AraC-like DNA-binding protein
MAVSNSSALRGFGDIGGKRFESNLRASFTSIEQSATLWVNERFGSILFSGPPNESVIDALGAVLGAQDRPERPRSWLVDLSRLEVIDLRLLSRLFCRLTSLLSASIDGVRQAIVRPHGMAGAIVAALFLESAGAIPVCSFPETDAALEWIGLSDRELSRELDKLRACHRDAATLIGELRSCLDQGAHSLKDAARLMAMSPRTMQRRLLKFGTNFQQEVAQSRLRLAKKLMRSTQRSLKSIAFEAGYSSPQHFSAAFRRQAGVSPGRWREDSVE